ncbi:MAG TPA: 30S ribosomal protein S9 [Flavobacteriales bacterium]|nr:30S ribosomal protein S9 [Flavobacteriales bacterium]HIO67039.1 30S ribosomal protein S9 [Flavobacteriales bacterium]
MEVINTSGRRKKAIARVYLQKGKGKITVNKVDHKKYFANEVLLYKIQQPFVVTNNKNKWDVKVNLDGGGIAGQAEALRLAISKALVQVSEDNRLVLREHGLLTRDPRMVERKKPGQKKARKKFQFSKR